MEDLTRFTQRLGAEYPSLEIRISGEDLILRRGSTEARLRGSKDIGSFGAQERRMLRKEGRSYLDLDTGSLFVDAPGMLLSLTLGTRVGSSLSPYQCALLSMLLEQDGGAWFELSAARPQVDLMRLIQLEFGIEVSPMNMSRFVVTLRKRQILTGKDTPTLDRDAAFSALRTDFRLSTVGREQVHASDPTAVDGALRRELGPLLATGVSHVLSQETGAWVEPMDYLVDRTDVPRVRKILGAPVPKSYRGSTVLIRAVHRVPFGLLTLGRPGLQPLLALAEALRRPSPIARQAGLEAWERRVQAWT